MKLLRTGVTCFLLLTFSSSQLFAAPLPALLPPVPHPVFQYNNTQRTSENGVAHAGEFLKQGFQFVKDLFTGNFGQLGAGITQIGKYSMDGVKILFDPAGALVRQPLGFGQIVGRNLIAAAIAMPVSKGLEGLGVDSTMARLAGAFVSGGLAGLGGGLAGFINTGIQMYALQGVSELGMHLNLPPPLTQALSLAVNTALVDYFDPTFNLKANLPKIFPTFTQQLSLGGLDLLGRSLGINADIMKLIGLPLSAAVGGVVGDVMSGRTPGSLFDIVKNAVFNSQTLGGIVSIGANIGLETIGAPVILQNFIPGILGQLVASTTGNSSTALGDNLFGQIVDGVKRFGCGIVQGIGEVISFGAEVMSKGFEKALEIFGNIFNEQTKEVLYESSMAGSAGLGCSWQKVGSFTGQNGLKTIFYENTNGDTMIAQGMIGSDRVEITSDIGGKLSTEIYEGLGQTAAGMFNFSGVALANTIDGVTVNQVYGNNSQNISVQVDSQEVLKIANLPAKEIKFDSYGNLLTGFFVSGLEGVSYLVDNGRIQSFQSVKSGFSGLTSDLNDSNKFAINVTLDPVTEQAKAVFDLGQQVLQKIAESISGAVSNLSQWAAVNSERLSNYLQGYDFRTNAEIEAQRQEKIEAAMAIAQDGDLIFGNGDDPGAMAIKVGDRSFSTLINASGSRIKSGTYVHHVGIVWTDPRTKEKFVNEMLTSGPTQTKLEDFMSKYKDFEINRPKSELEAGKAAQYFHTVIWPDKNWAYAYEQAAGLDTTGLGLKRLICSTAVYESFRLTRLPGSTVSPGVIKDARISPQDIWEGRDEWDESLVEIYSGASNEAESKWKT